MSQTFGVLIQVYDELVWESEAQWAAQDMDYVAKSLTSGVELIVPLVVDGGIGVNWNEAKEGA